MLRAVSDRYALACLALVSPRARVENGLVMGLGTDHLDVADVLTASARASGGMCALCFGQLVASHGAEEALAVWIQREVARCGAFDASAFRAGAAGALLVQHLPGRTSTLGSFELLHRDGAILGADVHLPDARVLRVRLGGGEPPLNHGDAEGGDVVVPDTAAAFEATRSLLDTVGNVSHAVSMCSRGHETALGVVRLLSAVRQEAVCDASRGALRYEFEAAVPEIVRALWPLALPARHIRLQQTVQLFRHAPLDLVALCFQEPVELTKEDGEEFVMVVFPGAVGFGIGRCQGRCQMTSRARASCKLQARTAVPPSDVRGALMWRLCATAIKDISVFPRLTDSAEEDARLVRTAVDAVGFQRAYAAVWMNADEARRELADASSL